MSDFTIQLKDGRKIGYIEYGDKTGIPVLFFHGTPGSRLLYLDDDDVAKSLGVRLISIERPGFGLSTPKPNRTLLDWADDVSEVADQFNLHKFSIIGVSGGGAFAAACAFKLSERLHSATLIASATPFPNGKPPKSMMTANKLAFILDKKAPWLMRASYRLHKKIMTEKPEKYIRDTKKGNKHLNEWDRKFLQTDEDVKAMMLHLGEAFRMSVDECVNEPVLLSKPWGFSASEIKTPVYVWHGENDKMSPFDEMKKLAASIPDCETNYIPGAGHFVSEDEQIWREILGKIKKSHPVHE
ncbi:alpha/beta fold hydrolase [Cytobacillus sp. FJAT-54145]|uniref:Alpha/beta fold hydrolase n=1 Tax=Cytobacillus spartinae TaxID=3299023 RepID=A0ABW6KJ21_9BACI